MQSKVTRLSNAELRKEKEAIGYRIEKNILVRADAYVISPLRYANKTTMHIIRGVYGEERKLVG